MNYNELVSKFRELARDEARLRWVNNLRDEVLTEDGHIGCLKKEIEHCVKEVARNDYAMSKLEEANPDYADIKKRYEDSNAYLKKDIEQMEDNIKIMEEKKNKIMAEIEKVASGEHKVDADTLSARTKELINAYVKDKATEVVA
jgi:cell division protein FtsB